MKHNHQSQIILAVIIVTMAGCSNPNALPYYPQLQGTITLEDSTGTLIPPPYSGITVSIPSANLSTSTDPQGNFNFPTEPEGAFNEVIAKKGFDSTIGVYTGHLGSQHRANVAVDECAGFYCDVRIGLAISKSCRN